MPFHLGVSLFNCCLLTIDPSTILWAQLLFYIIHTKILLVSHSSKQEFWKTCTKRSLKYKSHQYGADLNFFDIWRVCGKSYMFYFFFVFWSYQKHCSCIFFLSLIQRNILCVVRPFSRHSGRRLDADCKSTKWINCGYRWALP